TFIAVAVFAAPAVLADEPADTRRPWLAPLAAAVVLAALAMFGAARLFTTQTTFVNGVALRLMQPNVPQDQRFNYANKQSVRRHSPALSARATGPQSGLRGVPHLICPESAFPFFLPREPAALAQIAAPLPPDTVLITGAARPAEAERHAYNSI